MCVCVWVWFRVRVGLVFVSGWVTSTVWVRIGFGVRGSEV